MKKLFLGVFLLLAMALPFVTQQTVMIDAAGNGRFVMPPGKAVGYGPWTDVYNYGFSTHKLDYRVNGTPASFTLTLECSNTGADVATSVLGTGTTVTGGQISATSTYCTRVRWHISAISGTATIYFLYSGSFPGGAGGGGGATTQDSDDGTVAGAQTADLHIGETYVWDGSNWKRFTLVTEDAAETPAGLLLPIGGVRRDTAASSAGADGDNATFNFASDGGLWTKNTIADAAEGASVASSPVPIGSVYRVPGSAVTLDDGDVGYPRLDVNAFLFSRGLPAGPLKSGAVTTAMTGTTSTVVIAAQASNYLYVTSCTFSNDHASVGTLELLQDGSGGTTLWKGPNPSSGSATNVSGSTISFNPALKVPTLGNALYVANVTTSSSTYVSCSGWYSTISF